MDARRDVLLSYARYRGVELSEDIADSFSQKTDGYDVVDLRTILESAIASASRREDGNVDALRLLSMDLHKGMDGYVPVDQATLVKSSGRGGEGIDNYVDGFDSIGGYDDIKTILDDAIALPARHPKIFAQCPLRLPSGVLLRALRCGKVCAGESSHRQRRFTFDHDQRTRAFEQVLRRIRSFTA